MDWKKYRLNFPERYFKRTFFDEKVESLLQIFPDIKTVLEVGGGYGSGILKLYNKETWLLDPFVDAALWMKGKIDWDSNKSFDLVIARGSINYLTKSEIKKIPKFGNLFLANSFDNPPDTNWTGRPFSTLTGRTGVEYFRYVENSNIIEHKLKFLNSDEILTHSFYYYSIEQYQEMLEDITIEKYGKNSILLSFNKKTS